MSKGLIALSAVALLAVSCSHGVSRIQTRTVPKPNPTTYTFSLPLADVHTGALQAFSMEQQMADPIFGKPPGAIQLERILSLECSTNAVMGKTVFDDPANTNDIYLHSFHSPFTVSPVYHGDHGGLPFIAAFHLHLADQGSNTLVTVTASGTEVINGTKFGLGSCGPGQVWNCVRVKPTGVEEYLILTYLGRHLGFTNMPPVNFPVP